jgi:hypothetical protein
MNQTKHAQARLQQRNIPPLVVEWLRDYGTVVYSHGAEKLIFDKAAKKRLEKGIGAVVVDRCSDLLDVYIVVGEGDCLVTAAHRSKRIWRH